MVKASIVGMFLFLFCSCRSYNIQEIDFETSACFGTCPIFELKIDNRRHATYYASLFNKDSNGNEVTGTFATKIDRVHYEEIQNLLQEIDFPNVHDNYAVESTDHPTAKLKITYNNGQTKLIEDYGEQGTLGLKRLYEMLFALRLNQNWH